MLGRLGVFEFSARTIFHPQEKHRQRLQVGQRNTLDSVIRFPHIGQSLHKHGLFVSIVGVGVIVVTLTMLPPQAS